MLPVGKRGSIFTASEKKRFSRNTNCALPGKRRRGPSQLHTKKKEKLARSLSKGTQGRQKNVLSLHRRDRLRDSEVSKDGPFFVAGEKEEQLR